MGAWVYARRCLTFEVKIKLINIRGHTRIFFGAYNVYSLYFAACAFSPISKFGPLPSENPRCATEGNYSEYSAAFVQSTLQSSLDSYDLRKLLII